VSDTAPPTDPAIEKYRALAGGYDRRTARLDPYRERAIQRLLLRPGDSVLDVACGTGANFSLLGKYVGPRGRIIGVDISVDMLDIARQRARTHGWRNVELIQGPVESARPQHEVDAALFSFTHDVLRSTEAVRNVLASLNAGGRVAATGMRVGPPWALPLNLVLRLLARPYVTTYEGLRRPWDVLEADAGTLHVETLAFGTIYVASSTVLNR